MDENKKQTGWAAYAPLSGAAVPMFDRAASSARPEGTPDEEAPPPAGTPVWLTEWQVAEVRLDVGVGDRVDWRLVAMDAPWLTRLFGDRRRVDLQLDLYAEATGNPDYTDVSGTVVGIEVVRCPLQQSTDPEEAGGWVPVPGQAWTTLLDRTVDLPPVGEDNISGFIVYLRED